MSEHLKRHIRDIPDFPKQGILFRDITPLLMDPKAFSETVDVLRRRYEGKGIDKFAAIESRGFFFASPLAYQMGVTWKA